jgi:putative FmdB family regulatory protein
VPIHEYKCDAGHVFERFFATFAAADAEAKETLCDVCQTEVAERQVSAPGLPILYGEGFYKPAASGKMATKSVDVEKFIKEEGFSIVNADTGQKVKPTKTAYERAVATAKRTAKKR